MALLTYVEANPIAGSTALEILLAHPDIDKLDPVQHAFYRSLRMDSLLREGKRDQRLKKRLLPERATNSELAALVWEKRLTKAARARINAIWEETKDWDKDDLPPCFRELKI